MPVDALPAPRMTHNPDPPLPDLGHTTGIPLGASLRISLCSGLLFLLAWAWSQLWRVGLQPKPRGQAKLVNPEARAEKGEDPFLQAPGPWPEVRRSQASSSPLSWAGQLRKKGDEGATEGPAYLGSQEQKIHDEAAKREKPGSRPAGLAQRDDGQEEEGAATGSLMGQRAHQPGENKGNENEDRREGVGAEMMTEAPGSAEQSPPSLVDSSPQDSWSLAWQLREEAEERGMGGSEGDGEEGADSQPPAVLTSPLLRSWAYRPGEDEDEEEEDVSDGEGGAGSQPPAVLTSPLLRAWAYRPGEDEDEEEEDVSDGEEEDVSDGEGGAGSQPPAVLTSPLLRAWAYQPEEEKEDWEDARGEAVCRVGPGLQLCRVSIFAPGAEQPTPWPSPQLPQRLKRRLRPPRRPVEPEPEPPPGRKVRFSSTVGLHLLVVWAGPARASRQGPWEQLARDRSRFARRIAQAEAQLGPCLSPTARARAWTRLQALTISPEPRTSPSPPAAAGSSFQAGPAPPEAQSSGRALPLPPSPQPVVPSQSAST